MKALRLPWFTADPELWGCPQLSGQGNPHKGGSRRVSGDFTAFSPLSPKDTPDTYPIKIELILGAWAKPPLHWMLKYKSTSQ